MLFSFSDVVDVRRKEICVPGANLGQYSGIGGEHGGNGSFLLDLGKTSRDVRVPEAVLGVQYEVDVFLAGDHGRHILDAT